MIYGFHCFLNLLKVQYQVEYERFYLPHLNTAFGLTHAFENSRGL